MKEPTTPDEASAFHDLLRADPQRYIQITNDWIRQSPDNSHAYYDRHLGWMRIGEPQRALDDLNRAIELSPNQARFEARGNVHRNLGDYEAALRDYKQGDALDPTLYEEGLTLLYQADCHARLGDEVAALACCARLPDDFWTPGPNDAPAGDKIAVGHRLRIIAAEARAAADKSKRR